MGRAPCCDKANVKKGPWSPEEDAKLKAYIEQYGTGGNWIALPQKIGLKRCGKSCRLRWLNYLRPNIKHGGFSEEEDNIICSLYISIGSRWSIIAAQLPGRTDNDIKNYWNTRLKKKLLGRRKQSNNLKSQDPNDSSNGDSPGLSSSALERLQLHMQLQSIENPFANFCNNPSLWPKLHPLQEKMIIESLNTTTSPNSLIQHCIVPSPDQTAVEGQKGDFYEQLQENYTELENSASEIYTSNVSRTIVDSTIATTTEGQQVSSFQVELENFLENKSTDFITQADQIAEFDCFKDMNCSSKDGFAHWWSNEFDMKSAATTSNSNSWNQMEGTYNQVYDHMGYNM
ncbi:hypothetical protein ACFE04_008129 [Oxalis oulophora]